MYTFKHWQVRGRKVVLIVHNYTPTLNGLTEYVHITAINRSTFFTNDIEFDVNGLMFMLIRLTRIGAEQHSTVV